MKTKYHVVIIGAGTGGLAAAERLLGHGLDILLIDENLHTGGQLLRKVDKHHSNSFARFTPDTMKIRGFELVERVNRATDEIKIVRRAQVLGIGEDAKVLVDMNCGTAGLEAGAGQIIEIQADFIVVATGVRERYLPFKGWTMPGVISLGAAQILIKSHGVLPGAATIVGGSSPLMMVLVAELLKNKGKVPFLLDENGFREKAGFLPYVKDHWPKLMEGAFYSAQMLLHRTSLCQNMRIVEAGGGGALQTVIAAKTDSTGKVITGTEREYSADTLAVGYGFIPNVELAVQAGCELNFAQDKGGWVVKVSQMLETSVPFISAVGEVTGVAGAKKSLVEGKLAAMSILEKLNVSSADRESFKQEVGHLVKIDQKQHEYASFLGKFCTLPSEAYRSIPDDTVICRCENTTMEEIRKGIELGFDTLVGLKKYTRSTMGRCQGRICAAVITDIVTALTAKTAEQVGAPGARMPVKNVPLGSFHSE